MADLDIPIPAAGPSYRVARTRAGLDAGTKRLLLVAGGIGTLLLALTAGWAVSHRTPGIVPVIEADGRPIRVKPENAGGMQFVGADEQLTSDGATASAQNLAPPPEAPAASALRAQAAPSLPVEPAAVPSAQAVASAPPPVALPAALPAAQQVRDGGAARAATQVGTQATARTSSPAVAAAPVAPVAGNVQVQLAAVDTEQAAGSEWQRLSRQMPDLLGQRRLAVQHAERGGKSIWRVRTGGFADIADATAFCGRVRAKGGNCSIANF